MGAYPAPSQVDASDNATASRSLVLWFPDWPVTAWLRSESATQADARARTGAAGAAERGAVPRAKRTPRDSGPIAVIAANRVAACSAAARAEGVHPGQRRREAQSRCPGLQLVAADPDRDRRVFSTVLEQLEQLVPGVQPLEPGLCAIRARGPARYFGGEEAAARALIGLLADAGVPGVHAGVADGIFTAEQAARAGRSAAAQQNAAQQNAALTDRRHDPSAALRSVTDPHQAATSQRGPAPHIRRSPVVVIPPGRSAEFLAPLPVTALGDEQLAELLPRLGVRTLGAFAALGSTRVAERFGPRGQRLHALAAGRDARPLRPRIPPPEFSRELHFEPALELVEQVAFGIRITAEQFVDSLTAARLVCTELRVLLDADGGEHSERVWLHPSAFDAAAVVDRVRWQVQAAAEHGISSGIARVRLEPAAVDAIGHHEPGLFGGGPGERVHHALSRVQALLGHRGVVTPLIGGGRWLAERQVLVPWGDRPAAPRPRERPWPGSLPAPAPATLFARPLPVEVLDAQGRPVSVDPRGRLSAAPAAFVQQGSRLPVVAWAGPWPIAERGWDRRRRRRACRFQLVDGEHTAWLLVTARGQWWAEARYD